MSEDYFDMEEDLFDPYEESEDIYEGEEYDDPYDDEFAPEYYDPYEAAEARVRTRRSGRSRRGRPARGAYAARGQRLYRPPLRRGPGGRPPKASARGVNRAFQRTQAVIDREKVRNRRRSRQTSRRLRDQDKLAKGTQTAFALSQAVDAWKAQNPPFLQNDVVKAALPLAPLLFLRPGRPKDAKELATDPRVWAGLLTAGAAVFGQIGGKAQTAQNVEIKPGGGGQLRLAGGKTLPLSAKVLGANGAIFAGTAKVTWTSSDPTVASVDPDTGVVTVTGSTDDTAVITATIDGTNITDAVVLEVK